MGNETRNIDLHHNHKGNKIINSSLNVDDIQFLFFDIDHAGQSYELVTSARYPFTIKNLTVKSDDGTISVTVSINSTGVTGMTWVDAVYAGANATATADNEVDVGDSVILDIADIQGSPTKLIGNLEILRT